MPSKVTAAPTATADAPHGPPLVRKEIGSPPPSGEVRQARRASRHDLKRAQRLVTAARSSSLCLLAAAAEVSVGVGRNLTAHVSGVHRCGSPWSCPVCAPVVRERRAAEIDQALGAHLASGGSAVFVTQTLRHSAADALAPRLDPVSRALAHCLRGSSWERRRKRLGYLGSIKAVEITHGSNGWHPHAHSVLLFDQVLDEVAVEDLRSWLHQRWEGVVVRRGLGTLDAQHGVDVRPVRSAGELAGYLAKVDGGWGAGLELTRTDLKRNSPLDLLRSFVETGEVAKLRLWQEYEEATFGKRAIVMSPAVRERYLTDPEESDEALAASEAADVMLLQALVPSEAWNLYVRSGALGGLLTDVEHVAAALLMMSDLVGWAVGPLRAPDMGRAPREADVVAPSAGTRRAPLAVGPSG